METQTYAEKIFPQTRENYSPSDSAPFRQFFFNEVAPREVQLEANDPSIIFLNIFYNRNKLRACNLTLFMKSILEESSALGVLTHCELDLTSVAL